MNVRACALMTAASTALTLAALPALAQPKVSPAIAAAVADTGRPAADTALDATRKPADVLAFAGVKPGDKVEEFFPGGGYYTRILSKTVGPKGHLFLLTPGHLQSNPRFGKGSDDLAAAVGNATVVWQPADTPLTPEKVDVVWNTDNYHDYRNPFFGSADMAKFNKAVFDSLKPGGVYIIVDYIAAPGAGATQTNTLHRIEPATVKQEVEAAGFKLEAESKVLANPADDHTKKESEITPRFAADHMVLKFRKPK